MDHREFRPALDRLLRSVAARSPEHPWDDVTHLVSFGEEEEAMDVLVATLVHDAVPVNTDERARLRGLTEYFHLTPEQARYYRYLAAPEMLDRLNVVDTDGPST